MFSATKPRESHHVGRGLGIGRHFHRRRSHSSREGERDREREREREGERGERRKGEEGERGRGGGRHHWTNARISPRADYACLATSPRSSAKGRDER